MPVLGAALGFLEERMVARQSRFPPRRATSSQCSFAGAKTFQQLVFKRQEELTAAGVALPAGASGQLAVDT